MLCTGCGTQSADSDVFCGGCGVAKHPSTGTVAPPDKAAFNLGAAMRQQPIPASVKGRRWSAVTFTLIALAAVCVIIAAV